MSEYLTSKDEQVLSLQVRRRVYELVLRHAGCHFRALERLSQLATGSIKYHLDYLVKHGLVLEKKSGKHSRYFPRSFTSSNTALMGLLRQKSVRGILLYIVVHPGCIHEEIVDAIRLSPSTVSWHVRKLVEASVVTIVENGRKKQYSLSVDRDEIRKLLITYQHSFLDSLVDSVIDMWEM